MEEIKNEGMKKRRLEIKEWKNGEIQKWRNGRM